ncbi:MAG: AAA family ATPase [Gammaproteobacteria bacterium]|nr:AAA family ATPase [Gammaproteobacteria bacterium]
MYKDFFGLKETPFTISPDPRYLFMSERHRDALAHLLYGIGEGGGFVLLTGEVGTGKTTVCRCLLEQLPKNVRLAYILNPKLNSVELMATMCDELGIHYKEGESSLKTFTDLLSNYLLKAHEQGLNTVLMIDEAQNLSVDVLEQIRLLTNLETNQKKLLQIILIGQPELQELLAKKELRQLAQRITARYHLRPLSVRETKAYLEHRLRIAGANHPIFTNKAIQQIHKSSQGVPRIINVISDRALLGAFSENQAKVTDKTIIKATDEVLGKKAKTHIEKETNIGFKWSWLGYLAIVPLAVWAWFAFQSYQKQQQMETAKLVAQQEEEKRRLQLEMAQQQSAMEAQLNQLTPEKMAKEFWNSQSWDRNGSLASQNLLALWGVEYTPYQSGDACNFVKSYTLECDNGTADWAFLEKLNRPVSLKFQSGTTGTFWGVLTALTGNEATLQFGTNRVVVSRDKLNPIWTGEYQLFWKKPSGMSESIKLWSRGSAVNWLVDSIGKIEGSAPSTSQYNRQVKDWVEDFQKDNGLISDGVVGKHTVIMINNLTVDNIPTLTTQVAKGGR